jgi:16S rRNA processing protein RimM
MIFEGFNSYEKVKEFAGCNVMIPLFDKIHPDDSDSEDMTGFSLFSENDKYIGSITGIMKNPGQWLLVVSRSDGKEILIPLHEDLIVGIDKEEKRIIMIIPEGLLDLNT